MSETPPNLSRLVPSSRVIDTAAWRCFLETGCRYREPRSCGLRCSPASCRRGGPSRRNHLITSSRLLSSYERSTTDSFSHPLEQTTTCNHLTACKVHSPLLCSLPVSQRARHRDDITLR